VNTAKLQTNLLQLPETDIAKTTALLVEEFRMDYSSLWNDLEIRGKGFIGSEATQ